MRRGFFEQTKRILLNLQASHRSLGVWLISLQQSPNVLGDLVLLVSSLLAGRLGLGVGRLFGLLLSARQRMRPFDFLAPFARIRFVFAQLQSLNLLQSVQFVVGGQCVLELFLCLLLASLRRFVQEERVQFDGDVRTGGSVV